MLNVLQLTGLQQTKRYLSFLTTKMLIESKKIGSSH